MIAKPFGVQLSQQSAIVQMWSNKSLKTRYWTNKAKAIREYYYRYWSWRLELDEEFNFDQLS